MTSELQKYFSISFVVGAHIHKSSYVIVSKGATNPWYRVSTEIFTSMILFKIKIMMKWNGSVNIAMIQEFFQQLFVVFLSGDAQNLVRIRYLYLVHVCGTDFSMFLNSIFLSFAEPPFHALRAKKMDIYSTNQIASTHMDVNIAKIEKTS